MINFQIETMKAYHLKSVIELERLIRQPQINLETFEDKSKRHRLFLEWSQDGKALSKIVEYQNIAIAFYHLIFDPQLIQNFYANSDQVICKSSYLAQISIDPNYQSQGLGKILMSDIYEQSIQHGKNDLLLEVNSKTKAYQFYLRQDFQDLESQVFMKKSLI
ncbi:MAG: GNAT family N-acetyltransferase [Candidatus Cloacimonetes bacterium]|nr:GNAT family N-acetyltransferase [Candidatus Cloacimonadota bacterium]